MQKPEEAPALYNSKIIVTYLSLIRQSYGGIDIPALLDYAGMKPYEVEDEGHWFTQAQVDRFYERLELLTGKTGLAREAGRFNASPESFGEISRYVLGLAGPARVFETIGKLASNLTRSSVYESTRLGPTEIELTVRAAPGVSEKPYQCENRMGYFEAIVSGFNYRMPKIEHPECMFHGGKVCRYRISWRRSSAAAWKAARNVLAGVIVLGLPATGLAAGAAALFNLAGVSAVLLFALSFLSDHFEKRELNSAIDSLRTMTEKYFEDSTRNYNRALMVNEIGHVISASDQIDTMLSRIMDILRERLEYDRGIILLADEERRSLVSRTAYGYSDELIEAAREASFHLDKPESTGVFVRCFREKRHFLINDIESIEGELSAHSLEFLRMMGTKSFICCPILYENECLGVLAVDNLESKRPLLESDINVLMGIAPEIGVTINSAILTEERERQFRSILSTLAASIDARDNLTAGHSDRVTKYAMAICGELGVPNDLREVIRVASQLHDYGKIGIKDSILKKSGPLTAKEREEIKTHVVKTEEILKRINFTGDFRQVPIIAGAHHERLDGTGYPKGLKGEDIPLGARIIAVADFFEAITAKRHYHDPLPIDAAVFMLKRESGHHLDDKAVQALIAVLKAEGDPERASA